MILRRASGLGAGLHIIHKGKPYTIRSLSLEIATVKIKLVTPLQSTFSSKHETLTVNLLVDDLVELYFPEE